MASDDEDNERSNEGNAVPRTFHYLATGLNPFEKFDFLEPVGWARWKTDGGNTERQVDYTIDQKRASM